MEVLTLEMHAHVRLLAFLVDFFNDTRGLSNCQVTPAFRDPNYRSFFLSGLRLSSSARIDGETDAYNIAGKGITAKKLL
jgi:hypothetical protein